jgi:ketosteroid isomerase-like protein
MVAFGGAGESRARAVESIADMLDSFHAAAAAADENGYFAHFTENAVFLGTDPVERWPLAEFRAWAAPHFQGDSAWTYHAVERHVEVAPCGDVGWFDEVVRNEKYGDLRGTGVVLLVDGRWRIAQYNLTFTIPNEDAGAVLDLIKARSADR